MSAAPPHPSRARSGPGALLLRLLAGLLVVYAGLTVALFIPFTLLDAAVTSPGEPAPGVEPWMMYLWCLFAFLGSIWVVVAGVGAMEAPRPGRILLLVAVVAAVFLAFPPFWTTPA